MVKLFFILLLLNVSVFGRWHSDLSTPDIGQMFAYFEDSDNDPYKCNLVVITHYRKNMKRRIMKGGWYDVDACQLWAWIEKGNRIYYLPGDRTEGNRPWER